VGRVTGLAALLAVVAAEPRVAAVWPAPRPCAAAALAITLGFVRARLRATPPCGASWPSAVPLGLTLAVAELYFRADTFILALSRPAADVGHSLAYRVYELLYAAPR
jgi:hypothetical protein